MYYNPKTGEQKSLYELKRGLNASIPPNAKQIGDDWFLLKYNPPHVLSDSTKKNVKGAIKLIDGAYTQTYDVVDKTAEEIAQEKAQQEEQRRYEAEQAAEEKMRQAKDQRNFEILILTVPYNGVYYDANEVAQERMGRVVSAYKESDGAQTIQWVDAENVVQNITVNDLRNILKLAVEATTSIWVKPYEETK